MLISFHEIFPNCEGGHTLNITRPTIKASGTGPNIRESYDNNLLSPSSHTCPRGTYINNTYNKPHPEGSVPLTTDSDVVDVRLSIGMLSPATQVILLQMNS